MSGDEEAAVLDGVVAADETQALTVARNWLQSRNRSITTHTAQRERERDRHETNNRYRYMIDI